MRWILALPCLLVACHPGEHGQTSLQRSPFPVNATLDPSTNFSTPYYGPASLNLGWQGSFSAAHCGP